MSSKNLIAELEFELISTSKLLNLVPSDKLNWQPHPKAMNLGALALHVAMIPGRNLTFGDSQTATVETFADHPLPKTKKAILEAFGKSSAKAKELLTNAYDNWKDRPFTLTVNDSVVLSLPSPLFTRLLVFNHWYHHRGELVTYLRTLDVLIPSVYGPSADENPFG